MDSQYLQIIAFYFNLQKLCFYRIITKNDANKLAKS